MKFKTVLKGGVEAEVEIDLKEVASFDCKGTDNGSNLEVLFKNGESKTFEFDFPMGAHNFLWIICHAEISQRRKEMTAWPEALVMLGFFALLGLILWRTS